MRLTIAAAFVLLLAGCGSPSGPTPAPARLTVTGAITETLSGAPVGTFTQEVTRLPAIVTVSAAGFLTRQALVSSATPTVDLIRDAAPFDLTFYRQFVRNAIDAPTSLQALRRLTASPSIYLQRTGLPDSTVATLEQAARAAVPALTGGRFQVAAWEIGDEARAVRIGWITVELVHEPDGTSCGRANVGEAAGHIWLNTAARCSLSQGEPGSLAHELGHALGFFHVSDPTALMASPRARSTSAPNEAERHHAAVAYSRPAGNRDVDTDGGTVALTPLLVD